MQVPPKIQSIVSRALAEGVVEKFFNFFMGRCTFAAIMFSVFGVYGWVHGRDLTSYALFVTAIQGLLVLHSWKEDVAEARQIKQDKDRQ